MEIVLDRQQGANAWLTIGLREGASAEACRSDEHRQASGSLHVVSSPGCGASSKVWRVEWGQYGDHAPSSPIDNSSRFIDEAFAMDLRDLRYFLYEHMDEESGHELWVTVDDMVLCSGHVTPADAIAAFEKRQRAAQPWLYEPAETAGR
mgnify:CR=1 FL=1